MPRDVSVQLFRRIRVGTEFLMLRRTPERGGFWQPVTGAPLPGERDVQAAIRETWEETGLDVREALVSLGVGYVYALDPARAARWAELYGSGVTAVHVVCFGAQVAATSRPVIDPHEHDAYRWCDRRTARHLLDWPVERDAFPERLRALDALAARADARSGSGLKASRTTADTARRRTLRAVQTANTPTRRS